MGSETSSRDDAAGSTWVARRGIAFAIRALAFLLPIAVSIGCTAALSRVLPPAPNLLGLVVLWVLLSGFATAVLWVADRLARRLLPLSALFGLSLVFPDRAPSRFRTALRNGTVRQLEVRIEQVRREGIGDDPVVAAERLVELLAALSHHDRLTRGHSERVRAYSRMIGEELGLSERDLDRLHWAGLAHDVGKLFVPYEILNKPGSLTDEEFEVIKGHTTAGDELIAPLVPWLGDWSRAVGEHHERWDGAGYPNGLRGEEISLAGRIVSVADVFDVITSVRSYKKAMPAVDARKELLRCAGTHFDPKVVRAFLSVALGRLRLVIGPLSWLANAPVIGKVPVGPAIGAASGLATAATLFFAGLLQSPQLEHAPAVASAPVEVAGAVEIATPVDDDVPAPIETLPETPVTVSESPWPSPPAPTTYVAPRRARERTTDPVPVPSGAFDIVSAPTTPGAPAPAPDPSPTSAPTPPTAPAPATPTTEPAPTTTPTTTPAPTTTTTTPPAPTTTTTTAPPPNRAPAARGDIATVAEDTTLSVPAPGLLGNDDDPDGDVLTATTSPVAAPGLGTLAIATDGSYTFSPDPDVHGTDSFTYEVCDRSGACDIARVTIEITSVEDAPVAVDDRLELAEDDAGVIMDVLANDTDADGDALGIETAVVVGPSIVTVTVNPDQSSLTVVPVADANGTTTIDYVVADGTGRAATGTLTVTVTAVNDAPRATDDAFATDVDAPLAVSAPGLLANDSDEDAGDVLVVDLVPLAGPSNGSLTMGTDGSFTYSPDPGFAGIDGFTYQITDGTLTAGATVTITVEANLTQSGLFLTPTGTAADTFDLSTSPPAVADPEPDRSDPDAHPGFTVSKSDQELDNDDPLDYQHWTHLAPTALTLRGPVWVDLWSTTAGFQATKDADYSAWLHDCASDGSDCRLLAATVDVHVDEWNGGVAGWANRTLSVGSVDTTVQAGRLLRLRLMFNHEDIWIAMSGDRPSRLVLTEGNATPVATDDSASLLEDAGPTAIDVTANDVDTDLDRASVTVTSGPTAGTATPNGDGTVTYAPDVDANGTDTFDYRVCDAVGQCATASVTITITAVNDAPAFVGGADQAVPDDAGSVRVTGWATGISAGPADESTQSLTFQVVAANPALFTTQPSIDAAGELRFSPAVGARGTTTVTVTLSDDGGGADTSPAQTFTISVQGNAVDDAYTVDAATGPVGLAVMANDSPPPSGWVVSTLTVSSSAGKGSTSVDPTTGVITYTPNVGATGTDTFRYQWQDGDSPPSSYEATVTITFSPPPV